MSMFNITILDLVQIVEGVLVFGDPSLSLFNIVNSKSFGVSMDSRSIQKNDIFFALVGEHFDGHHFLNDVIQKGASVCIVSQIPQDLNVNEFNSSAIIRVVDVKTSLAKLATYHRKIYGEKVHVVGVCGSNGKTTVKEMTAQILALEGNTIYSLGNLNNEIGCPLSVLKLLPENKFGVFEMGASAIGDIQKLSQIVQPQVSVITNISLEHPASFGNLENIAKGESEVLVALPEHGCAVLPADDNFYTFLKSRVPVNVRIISFGFSSEANVYVSWFSKWPASNLFHVIYRDENKNNISEFDCELPVQGQFNILNACAAIAVSLALNVSIENIQNGLRNFKPPKMRFQVYKLENRLDLINDAYNANPSSMKNSLQSFVDLYPDRKKCLVLGDMLELGEISRVEHYSLGEFIARLPIHKIILVGSQTKYIQQGMLDSFVSEEIVFHYSDKDAAFKVISHLLEPETAILFKGSRGMHLDILMDQLLKDQGVLS